MNAANAPAATPVDTAHSPSARLRPVPLDHVRLTGGLWQTRRDRARAGLLAQHDLLETTGRLANLRRAASGVGEFSGRRFNDTDVYKWLEAAAWALAAQPDDALRSVVDETVELIAKAQQPDGFLNSYYILENAGLRWKEMDRSHQLYCAGHLFQAAVAHYRAGLGEQLLDVACRFADLICEVFGPADEGKLDVTDGHPEVEAALVELYRATGVRRYLDQASFFVETRRSLGRINHSPYPHLPFREYDRMAGHAVCHGYLNAGVADLYAEQGDATLLAALERQWHNATTRQTYITGGIGSRHDGEAFGKDYELPNERAYAETCASIASMMWNWRMLLATGDVKYADAFETVTYNAFLAGVSLDGQHYFYTNPLADDGTHRRTPWFDCACCPPNVARTLLSLAAHVCGTSAEGIWLQLYTPAEIATTLPDGTGVALEMRTEYPWDGTVELTLTSDTDAAVFLRVPHWCEDAAVTVNGEPQRLDATPGSYLELRRSWRAGDRIELTLPMPARLLQSHPYLLDNTDRVAIVRGPIVYCLEQTDNPGADLRDVAIQPIAEPQLTHDRDLLDGVTVIRWPAVATELDEGWRDTLYRPFVQQHRPTSTTATGSATAVPYYAWANRDAGQMRVWLRTT